MEKERFIELSYEGLAKLETETLKDVARRLFVYQTDDQNKALVAALMFDAAMSVLFNRLSSIDFIVFCDKLTDHKPE